MDRDKIGKVIRDHESWLYSGGVEGKQANLTGADLWSKDLRGTDLSAADLSYSDMSLIDLRGVDLEDADLRGADLCYADLAGADFRNAKLTSVDLRFSDLTGADFKQADLQQADLQGATLIRANLKGANLKFTNLFEADCLYKANLSRIKTNYPVYHESFKLSSDEIVYFPEQNIIFLSRIKGSLEEISRKVNEENILKHEAIKEYNVLIKYFQESESIRKGESLA